MNFISKIIRRESSSSDDSNEKAYSPTLPPRPSPKVVEDLDLPSTRTKKTSKRRPLSFAERFKKEQVPPTLPRPSPRTVRRITKSTKSKEKPTTKKKTTTFHATIKPIQNYAIKFLNRLRLLQISLMG